MEARFTAARLLFLVLLDRVFKFGLWLTVILMLGMVCALGTVWVLRRMSESSKEEKSKSA